MEDAVIRWFAPESAGPFNDWRLIFQTEWMGPWLWVLAAIVGVAWVASALGVRRVRGRGALLALRAAVLVVAAFLVLQPGIELRAVSPVRSQVIAAFDGSNSMELATRSATRRQAVLDHWERSSSAVARLEQQASLELFAFGTETQPVDRAPSEIAADDTRTDLGGLLADLAWQAEARDLGAVILYSDGADTEGLTAAEARRRAEQLGVPIHAVGFAEDDTGPDLAIADVRTDEFAFVHNTVQIEVKIEARNLRLASVPVTLKRSGSVLRSEDVQLAGGEGNIVFEFEPKEVGKEVYTISTPVQPGEVVAANNQRSLVMRVIRDRIRVLQVAGRPSWDVRFLRELLERNPNVDLISFFILRSTTDVQKASQEDLALIPFPVNELFTTELDSFDVVIYQNFSYRPYRMAQYLGNIRRYVLDGGSFLMVGGDQSFQPGYYAGTPIADVLPVRLDGGFGGTVIPWDDASFTPRLTPQGRRHPVTRIAEPGAPPERAYRRLPELVGMNGSSGLMPGAEALLEHPTLPGNPPVVAIREVRKGRSMSVATDSTWFWRFRAVADGGQGREYDRFWNQALRWLIRDPELSRVRVDARRAVLPRGEPVEADVRVLALDYGGLAEARVDVELVPVAGESVDGPVPEGRAADRTTDEEGRASLAFSDVAPGTYLLKARARTEDGPVGEGAEPVIVEPTDRERRDPFPRPEILRALADASGGTFRTVTEPFDEIPLETEQRVEVDRSRQIPLWDDVPWLFLLVGLLGAEWWLRRRAGLI